MKIAISGASGFVGTHLSKFLESQTHQVVGLERSVFENGTQEQLERALEGCDVVINLAGMPINHRWSKRYKQKLYKSRVGTTRQIVEAINSMERKPQLLISTSAVGYYPSEGCFDEYSSGHGDTFLSHLCLAWEAESQKVSPQVRVVNTRFGVVFGEDGGAFAKMARPARWGIAAVLGSGRQFFAWIDIDDLTRAMEFIIENRAITGAVNLIAPEQSDNRHITEAIADHYLCFLTIRIPELFLRISMGEASLFVTKGQCVRPTKLLNAGFSFNSSTIDEFLVKV